jgi:hypothetical protein
MKSIANTIEKIGTSFRVGKFRFIRMKEGSSEAVNIAGIVPKPKRNMKNAASRTEFVMIADANPI